MAETFYGALGVSTDADDEAIRQAFRERVKQRHPDVSDDPGAPREFKRLTTARSVLVDASERERYDRLGHDTYVERHLETSAWEPSDGGEPGSGDPSATQADAGTGFSPESHRGGSRPSGASDSRTRGARRRRDDRAAWLGDDWDGPRETRRDRSTGRRDGASGGGAGGTAAGGWQQAADYYRYTPSPEPAERSSVTGSIRTVLSTLGPWILVHLLFLITALATAWYTYASIDVVSRFSLPRLAFGVLVAVLVVALSAMHVVSLLYR